MKRLILLRGLPGAGKSEFANYLDPWATSSCAADDWMTDKDGQYNFDPNRLREVHEYCQDHVKSLMRMEKPTIVVHNTFTTEKELKPYSDMATIYGYNVVSLIVENRHNGQSVHNVPSEAIDRMEKRFEVKLR